ncbi:MAG: hypothetical protein FWH28_08935, partial [Clostridiales bacterium]|nr:hypothetical protein [Clostridiales bacterium]
MEAGAVLGVAQTQEGTLYTGVRDYAGEGWMTYSDRDGREIWTTEKGHGKDFLHPTALPNGDFTICREPSFYEDDPRFYQDLVNIGREGSIKRVWELHAYIRDIVALKDSFIALGNLAESADDYGLDNEAGTPFFMQKSLDGDPLREITFAHDYRDLQFRKAARYDDSLIIGSNAETGGVDPRTVMLMRCDLDGVTVWEKHYAPRTGGWANLIDLCVDDEGTIAVLFAERKFDEETGEPLSRRCYAAGLNMDGEELWTYTFEYGEADVILPVKGGFLCVSQGLDMENCPFIGYGWVLLLDREGNVKAPDSTPDISGGLGEIYGAAPGADGRVLLYGSALAQPGAPGTPFCATLDFPEAYR